MMTLTEISLNEILPNILHTNKYGLIYFESIIGPAVQINDVYFWISFEPDEYTKLTNMVDSGMSLEGAIEILSI